MRHLPRHLQMITTTCKPQPVAQEGPEIIESMGNPEGKPRRRLKLYFSLKPVEPVIGPAEKVCAFCLGNIF